MKRSTLAPALMALVAAGLTFACQPAPSAAPSAAVGDGAVPARKSASCEELRASALAALHEARECDPKDTDACRSAVAGFCGCAQVVADPAAPSTQRFLAAFEAFTAAGCRLPCDDAGCPPTSGHCSSPGQAPSWSCQF
jgi:hypothetical protein